LTTAHHLLIFAAEGDVVDFVDLLSEVNHLNNVPLLSLPNPRHKGCVAPCGAGLFYPDDHTYLGLAVPMDDNEDVTEAC
jgi:hypothetical protein